MAEEIFKKIKENITADAGYGMKENYDYLEKKRGLTPYVKCNTFEKEQDKITKKSTKPLAKKTFITTKKKIIMCVLWVRKCTKPMKAQKQQTGYIQQLSHIRLKIAEGCPLRGVCFKAQGNRSIERNHNLERHKEKSGNYLQVKREYKKETTLCRCRACICPNETQQQF